jgi:hypothetical protein
MVRHQALRFVVARGQILTWIQSSRRIAADNISLNRIWRLAIPAPDQPRRNHHIAAFKRGYFVAGESIHRINQSFETAAATVSTPRVGAPNCSTGTQLSRPGKSSVPFIVLNCLDPLNEIRVSLQLSCRGPKVRTS